MTTTTLSAAVTSTSTRHIYLASVTGVVAQTTSLLVDHEIMLVSAVEGKAAICVRGCSGTQSATHLTGATVYVLTAADFANKALGQGSPSFTNVNPDVEGIDFPDGTRQTTAGAAPSSTVTLTAAAPTVAAAQVGLGSTHQATVGAAGGASALPATPTGYLIINVAGTAMVIPYYAAS